MQVQEFKSADEIFAHYAAVKARLARPAPVKKAPPPKAAWRERNEWDVRTLYDGPIGPLRHIGPFIVSRDVLLVKTAQSFPTDKITGREIILQVAAKYGIELRDLLSHRRMQKFASARHEIFYRMKTETSLSFPQMGRLVGGRDHTTALHGYRRFKKFLEAGKVTL